MDMIRRQSKESSGLKPKFHYVSSAESLKLRFLLDLLCDAVYAAKVKSRIGNFTGIFYR